MIMRLIKCSAKRIVPRRIKEQVRRFQASRSFRRSMKRFVDDPQSCLEPSNPTLGELSKAWGNEGWSASTEYLSECIRRADGAKGPILECGSGLSTLLIAATARRKGLSLWSLEHSPEWASRVRTVLEKYSLHNATVCTVELRDYGEFVWYDPPWEQLPQTFSLVVCDGPPAATKGGRYGLAIMKERLHSGCTILLDDAVREHEMSVAKRWVGELDAELEVCGEIRQYIELRIK